MTTKKNYPEIIEVIPHRPPMILIDNIDEIGPDFMSAHVRITDTSLFLEKGKGVPVWVGLEYMAQTIAAFVGAEDKKRGETIKLGFLLGTRRFETKVSYFSLGEKLNIRISRVLQQNELGQFLCSINDQNNQELASAKISAYLPKDSNEFFRSQGL